MNFGEKLEYLLATKGMTQTALGERLGCASNAVNRMIRNSTVPDKPGRLIEIARVFDVSADFLLDDAADEPAPALTGEEAAILELIRVSGLSQRTVFEAIVAAIRVERDARTGSESNDRHAVMRGAR